MNQTKGASKTSPSSLARSRFQSISVRKLLLVVIIVGAATFLADLLPRIVPGARLAENWLSDFRFAVLAPPQKVDQRIIIAAINEDTLATFPYRSPVDRGFLIKLLNHLAAANVRAVGIDILFDQSTEPEKDAGLKALIAAYPVPVIVADTGTKGLLTKSQRSFLSNFTDGLISSDTNLIKDVIDGTVRGLYVERPQTSPRKLGFAAAIASALDLPIPERNIKLVYRSPPAFDTPAFKSYPAHTIQFLPKSWLAGKIVLIGADLPLTDRHKTIFSAARGTKGGTLPGVRIHAHALSQLLDNRHASKMSQPAKWGLLFTTAIIGIIIALLDTSIIIKGFMFVTSLVALGASSCWAIKFTACLCLFWHQTFPSPPVSLLE